MRDWILVFPIMLMMFRLMLLLIWLLVPSCHGSSSSSSSSCTTGIITVKPAFHSMYLYLRSYIIFEGGREGGRGDLFHTTCMHACLLACCTRATHSFPSSFLHTFAFFLTVSVCPVQSSPTLTHPKSCMGELGLMCVWGWIGSWPCSCFCTQQRERHLLGFVLMDG